MLSVVICLFFGVVCGIVLMFTETSSTVWSIVLGLLAALLAQAGVGLIIRKKVKKSMDAVQAVLLSGQKQLQQKVNQWQMRPPGSIKQAQLELEREQRGFVEKALERSRELERYVLWTPLLQKQIDTLRMQLYYQIKDFKMVDKLLPGCLFLDPITAAMKLARMYKNGDNEAGKFFEKHVRRMRYGQGLILYALYSWMLVQKGDINGAHKLLVRACEKNENEVLKRNRDHLANNRVKQFSNAGFGDEWYALGLEEPKIKMQRQRAPMGRPF